MTLHLYFARKFIVMLLGIATAFLLILILLDFAEQIRHFDAGTVSFSQVLELSTLNAPQALFRILPLVVMLATLALFMTLARTSELVVTRAAGRSALRSLVAPVVAALLVGGLTVMMFNPLVAATSKRYETLSNAFKHGTRSIMSISQEGLWLRQGTPDGQMVIRAGRSNLDGTMLYDVTFMAFTRGMGPVFRIDAESAKLHDGAWDIRHAKRWDFVHPGANPEQGATRFDQLALPSDLTIERIRDSFGEPSAIPIWELPDFINGLERAGFSARKHRVWFQMQLALPLMFAAMVMIGAGFTMRQTRFGRTGLMLMLGFGLGLGLFFLRNFAQVLGENGQIPTLLAAWSPPLIGILLALGLLLHTEDG